MVPLCWLQTAFGGNCLERSKELRSVEPPALLACEQIVRAVIGERGAPFEQMLKDSSGTKTAGLSPHASTSGSSNARA